MTTRFQAKSLIDFARRPDTQTVRILVVGNIARWKTLGRLQDDTADYAYLDMGDLHGDKIREIAPYLVLSPLVDDDFDAIDVAEKLRAADFSGFYCAVANDVPNADIIRREVKSVAPNLAFDLLILPVKTAEGSD